MTSNAGIPSLPLETCLVIFSKLDVDSLFSMAATCRWMRVVAKEDWLWKQIAAAKWGRQALDLCEKNVASNQLTWFDFCKQRLCLPRTRYRCSRLDVVQGIYLDPWQHILCCLLCCRTSLGQSVSQSVRQILRSERDWKDPREFYGCGKFVSDSWRIFCRGERSTQGVEDINLLNFLWSLNTGSFVDPNPRQLRSLTRQLEDARTKCGGVAKSVSKRSRRRHGRGQTEPGTSRVLRSHTKTL